MKKDIRDLNEIVPHAKYICLSCNHSEMVRGKKSDYQEVLLCPQCNGLFVDMWRLPKYEHLKSGQVNKIAEAAKEHLTLNNLLIIALKDESSDPKVFYKGEEVTRQTNITFDWESDNDDSMGGLTYAVERYVSGEGVPVKERLERHANGNAF